MRNKIICLILAMIMVVGMLASCMGSGNTGDTGNNGGDTGNNGGDTGNNGGDTGNNGGNTGNNGGNTVTSPYSWDNTTIKFAMNENSHGQQLTSGSMKYLAGLSDNLSDDVDYAVVERNRKAQAYCNVTVDYNYWQNTEGDTNYGWGSSRHRIQEIISADAKDQPDIFNTFMYDMMAQSLYNNFANLLTSTRGTNYFRFTAADYNPDVNDEGFMYEFMESLTLSTTKMYLLGSDYFFDTVRAFFIVPVNVSMLEDIPVAAHRDAEGNILVNDDGSLALIAGEYNSDRNGDNKFDVNDFIELIWNREWTYETLGKFAQAVYVSQDDVNGPSAGDILGFALESGSGFSASGVVYTSSITIIHKTEKEVDGNLVWEYAYPGADSDEANALYRVATNLTNLFETPGVFSANGEFKAQGAENDLLGIRAKFVANELLFGGFIMTGALEAQAYQDMKTAEGGGFAIAPCPLFEGLADTEWTDANDNGTKDNADTFKRDYQTQMHNLARLGAISYNTRTKFSQCTAFLNYQSTNSTDILNTYYDEKLTLMVAGEENGNAEVMKFIRSHVRSAFDKAYEDAISVFYENEDELAGQKKWHSIIKLNGFKPGDEMAKQYGELIEEKQDRIESLEKVYVEKLAD